MDFALLQHDVMTFGLQLKLMLFDLILGLTNEYMNTIEHIQLVLRDDPSPEMTVAMHKAFTNVTQVYGQMIWDLMQRL